MKYTLLDDINSPKDLKALNINQLSLLCEEIRHYMIECCATNPGHLGASLGAVELAVALHYVFNTPEDQLVWDVGHQAYAHKILTGRREAFKQNRMEGGISGFTKRSESPYDPFGAGHASTSVSAALGLATASALRGKNSKVVAILGDGAATGGLVFEGLNNAGAAKTDLLVILNDNQIAIDKNVGAMHNYLLKLTTSVTYNKIKNNIWHFLGNGFLRRMLQKIAISTKITFLKHSSIFESLGFRYFGTVDGNDIGELITTLSNIKDLKGPKLLHIRTVKGKGYKPAERNQSVWHAPGMFDIETGERVKKEGEPAKYQEIFGSTIVDLARKNEKIVGITPAMLSGGQLCDLMEVFPERTFDVGIAEEHAVTFAAALAAGGLLPFCNIYSSFLQRAFDEIIHDVALQNLKVIFTIDRAGLVGEDGATHQGAFDLSYLRLIPNLTEMAPMNEIELRDMLYSATLNQYQGPISIRYPRGVCEGMPLPKEYKEIEKGKGVKLRGESLGKVAILSIGTIGNNVAKALDLLEKEGIRATHYNMRFLKPLDLEIVREAALNFKHLLTIEDGTLIGGLYSAVCEEAARKNYSCTITGLGLPDRYIEQGKVSRQQEECGINVENIAATIKKFLSK